MSKYCPILKQNVVYLTCEDCDEKSKCTGKKTDNVKASYNTSNKNSHHK